MRRIDDQLGLLYGGDRSSSSSDAGGQTAMELFYKMDGGNLFMELLWPEKIPILLTMMHLRCGSMSRLNGRHISLGWWWLVGLNCMWSAGPLY